jgi:NADH dehydrogenase
MTSRPNVDRPARPWSRPHGTGVDAAGRLRVVIVGAGFGGLAAARSLAGGPVDVTIVDRHSFHTFSPLLYQVATSRRPP